MQKDEQIQTLISEIAEEAKATDRSAAAAVVLIRVGDRLTTSLIGEQSIVVELIARAVKDLPELAHLLMAGVEFAPYLAAEGTPCDCKYCVARRASLN